MLCPVIYVLDFVSSETQTSWHLINEDSVNRSSQPPATGANQQFSHQGAPNVIRGRANVLFISL